jgi:hypothetical protein
MAVSKPLHLNLRTNATTDDTSGTENSTGSGTVNNTVNGTGNSTKKTEKKKPKKIEDLLDGKEKEYCDDHGIKYIDYLKGPSSSKKTYSTCSDCNREIIDDEGRGGAGGPPPCDCSRSYFNRFRQDAGRGIIT